ncbi:MAG: U32 family peptidase [Candidatus Woesearchaeota archaeon]
MQKNVRNKIIIKKTNEKNSKNIEIMSPVGSFESLAAAIKAGADSVYFGVGKLNMRSRSAINFTLSDLKKISKICRKSKIRSYLALNTIVYDDELDEIKKICDSAKKEKISAVIATDISVIGYAKKIGLEVHISTQANVSNIEAVRYYSRYADVIVLARELAIDQIKNISKQIEKQNIRGPNKKLVKLELFVHGALCVSIAGKCYMSLAQYNHSANRGDCLQVCRRGYKVTDLETGDELEIDNKYVMSPKDLCTIGFLDKIIDAGISVLKIEGRGRAPDYVYTATKCYKEAVESIKDKTYTKEKIGKWIKELEKVFNRGFWHSGYYLGKKLGEWSGAYGSKAAKEKVYLGKALNYYSKPKIAHFIIESGGLSVGDEIIVIGPTTGIIKAKVKEMVVNDKKNDSAKKGDNITVMIKERLRKNDRLYKVVDRKSFQG